MWTLCGRTLASVFPLVATSAADARIVPAGYVSMPQRPIVDRVHAAAREPAHVLNLDPRTDVSGDTPDSSKYFKLTNITAEVHGKTGVAYGVNNDGRIAYTEGDAQQSATTAYIVNNGGTRISAQR